MKKKILLVDGHEGVGKALSGAFESGGKFSVIVATDVASALNVLLRDKGFDAVVSSHCCMKGQLNGASLLRIIRRCKSIKNTPFLGVAIFEEEAEEFIKNGADAVHMGAANTRELIRKVGNLGSFIPIPPGC